MHLTLKQATAMPPAPTLRAQQRAFDRFRAEYNQERPHEALGDRVPADLYTPSPRVLPEPPWGRPFDYPIGFEVVRISGLGRLRWNGRGVLLSQALRHERVGLEWTGGQGWTVWFGPLRLGRLTALASSSQEVGDPHLDGGKRRCGTVPRLPGPGTSGRPDIFAAPVPRARVTARR